MDVVYTLESRNITCSPTCPILQVKWFLRKKRQTTLASYTMFLIFLPQHTPTVSLGVLKLEMPLLRWSSITHFIHCLRHWFGEYLHSFFKNLKVSYWLRNKDYFKTRERFFFFIKLFKRYLFYWKIKFLLN